MSGVNLKQLTKGVLLGTLAVGSSGLLYALENVDAYDHVVHPHSLRWSHSGFMDSLDMRSVRRGYEVYKQVCAACHSMQYIRYRHFINTFMSENDAKKEAAEALIDDLDDKGEQIKRPGIINDYLPKPYKNKKQAAAANNGAAPPDLTLMALAREGGENYIFHLLTGYGFGPPEGIEVEDGKAYNPYFPNGGVLAMPQQLFDEGIEYEDGTPATSSQQAKDVSTFIRWTSEHYHDTRKKLAWKILSLFPFVLFLTLYTKRHVWLHLKSEKFAHRRVPGREWTPESSAPKPPKDEPTITKLGK